MPLDLAAKLLVHPVLGLFAELGPTLSPLEGSQEDPRVGDDVLQVDGH